jgi:hypothetical protein
MNKQVSIWNALFFALAACLITSGVRIQGCSLPAWTIGSPPPFATDKLSVLVIEESKDHGKYSADDTADDLQNAHEWVKAAMQAKRGSELPWALGATPRRGFSIPLKTEAELLAKVEGLK